jgi:hypothetical protein
MERTKQRFPSLSMDFTVNDDVYGMLRTSPLLFVDTTCFPNCSQICMRVGLTARRFSFGPWQICNTLAHFRHSCPPAFPLGGIGDN